MLKKCRPAKNLTPCNYCIHVLGCLLQSDSCLISKLAWGSEIGLWNLHCHGFAHSTWLDSQASCNVPTVLELIHSFLKRCIHAHDASQLMTFYSHGQQWTEHFEQDWGHLTFFFFEFLPLRVALIWLSHFYMFRSILIVILRFLIFGCHPWLGSYGEVKAAWLLLYVTINKRLERPLTEVYDLVSLVYRAYSGAKWLSELWSYFKRVPWHFGLEVSGSPYASIGNLKSVLGYEKQINTQWFMVNKWVRFSGWCL